jgi:hypothetical protein
MAAAVPVLGLLTVDESEIGLVYESGSLQSLSGLFLGEPLSRKSPEFVIHQRQKLL